MDVDDYDILRVPVAQMSLEFHFQDRPSRFDDEKHCDSNKLSKALSRHRHLFPFPAEPSARPALQISHLAPTIPDRDVDADALLTSVREGLFMACNVLAVCPSLMSC